MPKEMSSEELVKQTIRRIILWTLFLFIVLVGGCSTIYTVDAGERGVLLTWGQPSPQSIDA